MSDINPATMEDHGTKVGARAVRSIVQLPVEILLDILSHLCPDSPENDADNGCESTDSEAERQRVHEMAANCQALDAVSRTCSTLRHLAMPFLYQVPLPCSRGRAPSKELGKTCVDAQTVIFGRLAQLVRTLVARPELRGRIRHLHLEFWRWALDVDVIMDGTQLRSDLRKALDEHWEVFSVDVGCLWPAIYDGEIHHSRQSEAMMVNRLIPALALSYMDNLESLDIDGWDPERMSRLNVGTLNRLRRLRLMEDEAADLTSRQDQRAMSELLSVNSAQRILLAAPNLQSLVVKGAYGPAVGGISHDTLKELSLYNCQVPRSLLAGLVRGLPSLESLSLVGCSYSGWLRSGFFESLLPRKGTLRHLKMVLKGHDTNQDYGSFLRPAMGKLSELTALETLELAGRMTGDESTGDSRRDFFAGFLPASLRGLSIDATGGRGWLAVHQEGMQHMARVAYVNFPRLELVRLEMTCATCREPVNTGRARGCAPCDRVSRGRERLYAEFAVRGISRAEGWVSLQKQLK